MYEEALEVSPDFVFLAIDLPVALFKVLVSIADKAVSSTNQEKLLWQHGATEIVSPQVETKLHLNPIDVKVSPGEANGGEKESCKEKCQSPCFMEQLAPPEIVGAPANVWCTSYHKKICDI